MRMNRRAFLTRLGAVATGVVLAPKLVLAEDVPLDENFVMIFADTHCGPAADYQAVAMRRCVTETLAHNPRPANVLIYGDFAYLDGKVEDYKLLVGLVKPLEEAGIKWNVALGNHDRRDAFYEVFPNHRTNLVEGCKVTVVETPHADFLLLDSLIEGKVNGGLNDAQKQWLNETLKTRTKPVFVGAHHPLKETLASGIMKDKPCAVGYINGHHHRWEEGVVDGVKQLTLPSTGHWGDIGLVALRMTDKESLFKLHMHDYYKPRPAPVPKPEWKAIVEKKQGLTWRIDY